MLAAFATYGTALIVRPFGALLFGRMADLRGRRAVFVPVIVLMAGATAAVGFLPSYAAIGILAPVTLILSEPARALRLAVNWAWPGYSSSSGHPAAAGCVGCLAHRHPRSRPRLRHGCGRFLVAP